MACYCPLDAYYGPVGASGKRAIVFNRNSSFSGVPLKLPCGQCVGCRLEHSRQWAVRCMHENQMHDSSCFITLTYDKQHLPVDGSLVKVDLQLFMKRLRKRIWQSRCKFVRFYACGEYGDVSERPHYHVLLFGAGFPDRKVYPSRGGHTLYTSAELSLLWTFGHSILGDVTFDSCAYVARYVMKKVISKGAAEFNTERVADNKAPQFVLMSRRPGIGSTWYERYGKHAHVLDSVVLNGHEMRPPRFYDSRLDQLDSEALRVLKKDRLRKGLVWRDGVAYGVREGSPMRRKAREAVTIGALKSKGRDL